METRVLNDLALYGALVMSKDESGFPANPAVGTMIIKDQCIYAYIQMGGLTTWYPFANKTHSYIHTQGAAAQVWTVRHNLGTTNVWVQVQDTSGNIISVGKQNVDINTFTLTFTTGTVGTALVVAPDSIDVPQVSATSINVGSGAVTIDSDGVKVNGSQVLTGANIQPQIDASIAALVGDAPSSLDTLKEIADQLANDESAVAALTTTVASKASISYVNSGLAAKADTSSLATVATSGSYADLTNKPTIPTKLSSLTNDTGFVTSSQSSTSILAEKQRAEIAEAGLASSINSEAIRAVAAETALDARITNIQGVAVVSGDLAAVATSGSYNDLVNAPTNISHFSNDVGYQTASQVNSKVSDAISANNTSFDAKLATKLNSNSLATVATSGSYNDLTNKPTLPTNVSAFTNDANYQSGSEVDAKIQAVIGAAPDSLKTLGELATALANDESAAVALTSSVSTLSASVSNKADKATTLAGYGITDAYTKSAIDSSLASKANSTDVTNNLALKADKSSIPTVVSAFTNDVGYQTAANVTTAIAAAGYASSASLATVATSGSYTDLSNKPTLFSGSYADLSGKPTLFSGSYADLSNKPTIPTLVSELTNDLGYQTAGQVSDAIQSVVGAAPGALDTLSKIAIQLAADETAVAGLVSTISDKANKATTLAGYGITNAYTSTQVDSKLVNKADVSSLATVATTGSFSDLTNKPTTLAGYGITDASSTVTASSINSALGYTPVNPSSLAAVATTGTYASLTGKPTLANVATTGSYADLSGKPTLATVASSGDYADLVNKPTLFSGSYNDLTNKPATASLAGSSGQDFAVKGLTVSGDIMPAVSGVSNIGSATDKFNAIYTKEMHIDANTLYVDGVPVLGSSSNTITFTADPNQGMRIATSGSGSLVLTSDASTTIQTTGQNGDVVVQSSGQGALTRLTSATQITLTAPTVATVGDATVSGNLTVTGNFDVKGTVTTIESTVTTIKDNIITLNKGEGGSGVTLGVAGFDIDRGDLARQRLIWNETAGKWQAGPTSQEVNLATEGYVTTAISGKANTSSLATVATSGSYNDLSNKPSLFSGAYADLTSKPTLFSGAYADLTGKPTLATVASSGDYADLVNKPTIPTVPTVVSAFTNDSGYQTAAQVNTAIQAIVGAAPAALDTLAEIATQLESDESAAAALTTTVSGKADKATTLAGYGITDAITAATAASTYAAKATTLAGYGITDGLTSATAASTYAAKATTLAGYGIIDAYTKTAVDSALAAKANSSSLATVATSGLFADLLSKPTTLAGYGITSVSGGTF